MSHFITTKILGVTLGQKLILKQPVKERTSIAKFTLTKLHRFRTLKTDIPITTLKNIIPATNTILTNSHRTLKKSWVIGSAKDTKQSSQEHLQLNQFIRNTDIHNILNIEETTKIIHRRFTNIYSKITDNNIIINKINRNKENRDTRHTIFFANSPDDILN